MDTGKVTSEEGSFTGDGSLSEFTVTHGFGTDKIQVDVQDESGALCVFRIRKTVANVVVSADFAIPAGEKFIVVMHGQAEA